VRAVAYVQAGVMADDLGDARVTQAGQSDAVDCGKAAQADER
jgi:hypothetical protein